MIQFALKYLYILFIFVFVFLLTFMSNTNDVLQSYIIFSYFILLLPILDFLIEYFKSEFFIQSKNQTLKRNWDIFSEYLKKIGNFIWKYIHIVVGILILYFIYRLFGENILHFFMILFLFLGIYFRIDSRISFGAALILLLGIPLLLIIDQNAFAETLSIYLYYFLIIGVIFSICESFDKKISEQMNVFGGKIKNYVEAGGRYFLRYPDDVVYDVLFLGILSFIGSLYWVDLHNNLTIIILFIFLVYGVAKIFGFHFTLDKQLIPFFQKQNIEPFILFFSLSVIIFSSLGNMLLVENRILIFFSFTLVNFFIFSLLVTDLGNLAKSWIMKNTYIFAMIMIGIIGGIFYVGGIKLLEKESEVLPQINEEVISDINDFTSVVPENNPVVTTPVKFTIALFPENIGLGSSGENVRILQSFLNDTGYYNFSFHGIYDENTRSAMRRFLSAECNWPQTNQGILGNQERICIQEFLQK